MGGCFSFLHKPDLQTSTFSHYSLNSESSYLDLYPGFQYAETASVSDEEWGAPGSWRRSSAPLLDPWDDPPGPGEEAGMDSLPKEGPRLRYGEALVRLRRGLRQEVPEDRLASPRDSGSTVVEEI